MRRFFDYIDRACNIVTFLAGFFYGLAIAMIIALAIAPIVISLVLTKCWPMLLWFITLPLMSGVIAVICDDD